MSFNLCFKKKNSGLKAGFSAEKSFDKNPTHFSKLNKLGIKGNFLNLIKGVYEKLTANIIVIGDRLYFH